MANKNSNRISSDSETINDVLDTYEYEAEQQKDLFTASQDNYNYVRGNQWVRAEAQKAALEADGRPALSLNLILPKITLILGYNVQNRYDLRAYPAGKGTTPELAELITKLIKYITLGGYSHEHDIRYEMAQIVLDALCANQGGFATIDYTNEYDVQGELLVKRESPFYHLRDSNNDHYDLNRGEYHIRTKWLSENALLSTYPDRKKEIANVVRFKNKKNWLQTFGNMFKKETKEKAPTEWDYIDQRDHLYRVVEKWVIDREESTALYDVHENKVFKIPDQLVEKTRQKISALESRRYEITKIKPKRIKLTSVLASAEAMVEKEEYDVQNGMFPFLSSHAYWIDGQPLSNVENMKDFQDEHNKRSSQILQILNATGNSGWWARKLDDGDSVDMDDLVANGTKIGYVGFYKGDKPPEKIEPNRLPTGHQYMDIQAKEGLTEVSGIGNPIQGKQEAAGESGALFQKKVQQQEVMLTHFFDNIRKTKEIMGRYLVSAIPKVYRGERLYSITWDDSNQEIIELNTDLHNDITNGNFMVVLDEVDRSPTAQAQQFVEMMAFVSQGGIPAELVNWPEIIRMSPFPNKEKMAQWAERMMGATGMTPEVQAAQTAQNMAVQAAGETAPA